MNFKPSSRVKQIYIWVIETYCLYIFSPSIGARVIILCRNIDKGRYAADQIKLTSGASYVGVEKLDLASFESIRACAEKLRAQESRIDVLINNAGLTYKKQMMRKIFYRNLFWKGIMMCPQWETADGLEMQIGTNHFGHFLLTLLLLENIKAAAPSRVVTLSSLAHEYG